jgi:hypothetical protein
MVTRRLLQDPLAGISLKFAGSEWSAGIIITCNVGIILANIRPRVPAGRVETNKQKKYLVDMILINLSGREVQKFLQFFALIK